MTPQVFATDRQAAAWLAAERQVLLAAIEQAAVAGFPGHAFRLALTLVTFFDRRGYWEDMITALHQARDAARSLGDPVGQTQALRRLGTAYDRIGDFDRAVGLTREALAAYEAHADPIGQARTHRDLAMLYWRRDRRPDTLHHVRRVLDLSVTAGLRAGPAFALFLFACFSFLIGDLPRAVAVCRTAVVAYQQIGDRVGEAVAWEGCGLAQAAMGGTQAALDAHEQALAPRRENGERLLVADSLVLIGDTHAAAAQGEQAQRSWHAAYEILHELGHPEARDLAARLSPGAVPAAGG